MINKNILIRLFICLMLILSSTNLYALNIGSQEVTVTLTDSFVSRYIWRGQDLYAENDGAHQPSIDVTLPKLIKDTDVSFNIWGSFPLKSGHEDAEELDYTVTFSRDILDEVLNASLGYTYFDYPNTSSTADVSEPWLSVTLGAPSDWGIPVSFTAFAGYDFAAKSGGPDEGWYYSWGFDAALELPDVAIFQKEQTLSLGIVNWGNDGVADLKPSVLYATDFSLSTSYAFGSFSITPYLNYTLNYDDEISSGNDEIWGGIELSYAF